MADYETGYKKPPKHSRFQRGNCANPYGRRGKKERRTAAEIFNEVMNQIAEYREGGKAKRAPRIELLIKRLGAAALKGDVSAAANLLMLREKFEKLPDVNPILIPMTERDMNAA
jgi:Family of unknown function (DUF5681)